MKARTDWRYPAALAALIAMIGVVTLVVTLMYQTHVIGDEFQGAIDQRQCEHVAIAERQDILAHMAAEIAEVLVAHSGATFAQPEIQAMQDRLRELAAQLDATIAGTTCE